MSPDHFPPSSARILDANLNRAAEGLRVVEDLCRFHFNLKGPALELKELRHALLGLFFPDPARREEWTRFRDSEGDPGRDPGWGQPSPPAAPRPTSAAAGSPDAGALAVAVKNLERVKEALRTLEEVCRPWDDVKAKAVEDLRYRLYSIEKGFLHLAAPRGGSKSSLASAHLYLLFTRALLLAPMEEILEAAIAGGAGAVQMREKDLADRERLALGQRLREITARAGIPLIVNDRPDLALLIHADGVHLGPDDLPVAAARQLVGESKLLGVSTHSLEQARQAVREGADYIGIGPVFPTATKDAGPCLGLQGFREIHRQVDLPAFAIGGVSPDNIAQLVEAGAERVAVSSAILQAKSGSEARAIAAAISAALGR
ncbi:MAG: thiamine phosphate synthase [Planctomycetes bacterium]|nr:thiamine phosphate synthase [Planctomycetota bacterium]